MRKKIPALLLAAAMAATLAGCSTPAAGGDGGGAGSALDIPEGGADWSQVVEDAKQEGEVVWFTNSEQVVTDELVRQFNSVYPEIKVQLVRNAVSSMAAQYVQQRTSTNASPGDLLESSVFATVVADNPDWFEDITADLVPAAADYSGDAVKGKHIFSAAYIRQFTYNTDDVKEGDLPATWCDVTDPAWKGHLAVVDPRSSTGFAEFLLAVSNECGPDFLGDLAANDPTIIDGPVPGTQQVAAGGVWAAMPVAPSHNAVQRSQGAPIANTPLEPAFLTGTMINLPTEAPNPNAQRVLANFILSPAGQDIVCDKGRLSSLNDKATGTCLEGDQKLPESYIVRKITISAEEKQSVYDGLGLN